MTLKELLARSREVLAAGDIEDATLESELLLRHVLGISRVELYTDLYREASPEQESAFWQLVYRRLAGEPSAYITGHREFYGFDFNVDLRVLIPRPESELLVEEALNLSRKYANPIIADVGTGSGCIAVSLALNLPGAKIYATDVSPSALAVARLNCEKHGVGNLVRLFEGDLLEPMAGPFDLIVANLPYVRTEEIATARHLSFEPAHALDGGDDGLDKLRELCCQSRSKLQPGGTVLLEIGERQANAMFAWLRSLFPSAIMKLTKDLNGLDRMLSFTLPARAACELTATGVRDTYRFA
ncbi:MAG: peptide chain release factor N(5)-glutamine methyltransferase [Chloroflexi bacterium]|nr:peptide chain release factor N(5)-glutamine methyltransferase [Chloroflexota bacterium]